MYFTAMCSTLKLFSLITSIDVPLTISFSRTSTTAPMLMRALLRRRRVGHQSLRPSAAVFRYYYDARWNLPQSFQIYVYIEYYWSPLHSGITSPHCWILSLLSRLHLRHNTWYDSQSHITQKLILSTIPADPSCSRDHGKFWKSRRETVNYNVCTIT